MLKHLDLSRLRRQWRPIAVLLLVATIGFYLWVQKRSFNPLHAASEQAAVVWYARQGMAGLNAVLANEQAEAAQHGLLKQYRAAVQGLSALLKPDVAQMWAVRPQAAVFSLHPNDSLQPLLVLDVGEALEASRVLGGSAGEWSVYRFKGSDIYESRGRKPWAVAVRSNLLLASRFSYLVEEALVQLSHRGSWWKAQTELTSAPVVAVVRPKAAAEGIWAELALEWSGVVEALASAVEALTVGLWPDSSEVVVRTARAIPAGKAHTRTSVSAVLPDHVALYTWHTSEQPGQALAAFMQPGRNDDAFRQYVLPWCGREAAFVWLEPQPASTAFDGAWVCSVSDEGLARRQLQAYGAHTGMVRHYRYHAFEIRQFLDPSLLAPLLFHGVEERLQNPACSVFDGYAVFAPSAAALELWLDKYIVSQTLSNDPTYLTLLSRQRPESQWVVFINGRYLPLLAQKMLSPQARKAQGEIHRWATRGLLGLDFQPEGRGVWRASIVQQPIGQQAATAISLMWKTSLPAAVVGVPQWVSFSEAETVPIVLAQDAQGYLHCLETGGHLRWSKALGLPIRSSIRALGGLPGGQPHYVFNTAEALWMLDAQGREALGFPLRLQSPATNGVLIVPLESARRYGLFVACANGNVYGFDAYGRPLPGWNPKAGVGQVQHPLLHFAWANKDYIVALTAQGRLLCADRAGNLHFADVQLPGIFTATPPLCIWEKNTPYILCINDAGQAFRCSVQGQVAEYAVGWKTPHRHFGTTLNPAQNDGASLISLVSGQRAVIRQLSAKTSRPIELSLPETADTIWAADHNRFGLLSRSSRRVFLFHSKGSLFKGFPLGGHTPFDLLAVNPQEHWLVVGYDTEIYVYRLIEP